MDRADPTPMTAETFVLGPLAVNGIMRWVVAHFLFSLQALWLGLERCRWTGGGECTKVE